MNEGNFVRPDAIGRGELSGQSRCSVVAANLSRVRIRRAAERERASNWRGPCRCGMRVYRVLEIPHSPTSSQIVRSSGTIRVLEADVLRTGLSGDLGFS
jgi:hypothetical protein